ncbi:ubiE/COQ5 methyltransferase [Lunatimonas lonarensis]|uniref:UbiE/COQ5 methyltransferase n=1 Tax=Lunatimonas lonarensis TaxID=1232681 RepID=R7ZS18_9BACT|nr:class I SAM-dependent methyltransferase [Lunatimonas lonarensis]EON76794.1 ubiE/COQ5 methyltransferase [Lunatimonas lonarensis]
MEVKALNNLFGNLDIYLLDQILKGRFERQMKILDAGCGEGRNATFFIRSGFQVFGIDQDALAIQMLRMHARSLDPAHDVLRFQVGKVEELFFHKGAFDAIISSAVLHFARDEAHFDAMWSEMMRVLKPGGFLWLRTCTDAGGILGLAEELGNGRFRLPDGSERFVLSEMHLQRLMTRWGLRYLESPKSVLVHRQRSMGVFLLGKG